MGKVEEYTCEKCGATKSLLGRRGDPGLFGLPSRHAEVVGGKHICIHDWKMTDQNSWNAANA